MKTGNKLKLNTRLDTLDLGDYAKDAFFENDILTVGDALMAYHFATDTKGLGVKTWETFFKVIKKSK